MTDRTARRLQNDRTETDRQTHRPTLRDPVLDPKISKGFQTFRECAGFREFRGSQRLRGFQGLATIPLTSRASRSAEDWVPRFGGGGPTLSDPVSKKKHCVKKKTFLFFAIRLWRIRGLIDTWSVSAKILLHRP